MSYPDFLRPWAVYRCRASGNICVARFRTRGDAYAYLSILRRNFLENLENTENASGVIFEVVFDDEPAVKLQV